MNKITLLAPVYFKKMLKESEELMAVVPHRKINGLFAHDQQNLPYIVYSRTSVTPVYTKQYYDNVYRVQITYDIVTNDYEQGLDISLLLIKALEHKEYADDDIYIREIEIVGIRESSIEDKLAIQSITFESMITTH